MTVLILGGTSEARSLAAALVTAGVPVISSLAGRVARPTLPVGEVRIGGFGGVDGLVAFLRERSILVLVDATHPFAVGISGHAVAAAEIAGVQLVRLERPGWGRHPDAASWTWVAEAAEAVRVGAGAARPFLTTGRQSISEYAAWADRPVLVRVVDPPPDPVPDRWTLVLGRGPYAIDGELELMRQHRIDLLITKDSGGPLTAAKLDAARDLGVPVVVIRRPPAPAAPLPIDSVDAALALLRESLT